MKKLSKKQRNKVYANALNLLHYDYKGICWHLKTALNSDSLRVVIGLEEFWLMRPTGVDSVFNKWFNDESFNPDKENRMCRELILMFCIEMSS